MLTIDAWLRHNGARFQHELEILARAYYGISKAEFICESDQSITPNLKNYLSGALVKLKRGTPLAYLLGYKEFWSLEFQAHAENELRFALAKRLLLASSFRLGSLVDPPDVPELAVLQVRPSRLQLLPLIYTMLS